MSPLGDESAFAASISTSSREELHEGAGEVSVIRPRHQLGLRTPALSHDGIAVFTENEVRRRLWHILPGLLPFVVYGLIPEGPISGFVLSLLMCLAIGLSGLVVRIYPTIARAGEQNGPLNAVTYAAVPLGLILLFPAEQQLACVVLVVLAFGDGMATLIGLLWGKAKLPWNAEKTWIGSTAFLLCSGPMATLVYWLLARPAVSWWIAAGCGGGTAFLSMLVESIPSATSDNLRVSGTAAMAIVVAQSILVGW